MMSDIKVCFEIGHKAQLRSKQTPAGFTHDWEVFVRGQEGADISHFVDKVVFQLHDTFPKPRRVVKEPPFSIKESGYAGFMIPVEIYLKNKDEPKKIEFPYDFRLDTEGSLRDRYIFKNPNDDFRKKLLKGGGIISNIDFYESFTDEKAQMLGKSKISLDSTKKLKSKEHKEDMPYKNSNFVHLFGPPIQKPTKVSLDSKKNEKTNILVKSEKKDKDGGSSDKKSKHEHKDTKPDKIRVKEDKEKNKQEKVKSYNKEQDKTKDKPSKRPNDKPPTSPDQAKKRRSSPSRKPTSPSARSSSSSSLKEEYKASKMELSKPKIEEKPPEMKAEKEKKKKEKKSHDRDKERKEKKEHKKESHKVKDSPKEPPKEVPKEIPKSREVIKDKEQIKEKIKTEKPINKFTIENMKKTPPHESDERIEGHKTKDKGDSERKHKHKKKDKKRDESREKHKEERNKEKKHKLEKPRELPPEKLELFERRETPVPKERPQLEPQSPISIDTASQCSSKSGLAKTSHIGTEDINSVHSDSEASVIADEEESKPKVEKISPEPFKREPSPEPELELEPELDIEPAVEPEPVPHRHKEKSKKHKDKSAKKEEKRRKRKAAEEEDAENRKQQKTTETAPSNNDLECGESSGSTSVETKVQDNGVSSSLGEDADPGDLSPDYMVQLRGLQQRIMMIKNNEDLERVVNLIAETGRYEVTTQTFDFDLCSLDRSTVQQLIQLVGC